MQTSIPSEFKEALSKAGLRATRAKMDVLKILITTHEPQTMQQIIGSAKESHYVSVYRAVDALVKASIVIRVPIGLKYCYELSDVFKPHHHHIRCSQCSKTISVESDALESMMQKIASNAGFEITSHHLELNGVCGHCAKRVKESRLEKSHRNHR